MRKSLWAAKQSLVALAGAMCSPSFNDDPFSKDLLDLFLSYPIGYVDQGSIDIG